MHPQMCQPCPWAYLNNYPKPDAGVDVTKPEAAQVILQQLGNEQLTVLMICSGYQKLDSLDTLDFEDLQKHWDINTVGPLRLVQGLKHKLTKGSKVGCLPPSVICLTCCWCCWCCCCCQTQCVVHQHPALSHLLWCSSVANCSAVVLQVILMLGPTQKTFLP
eukprot:jgi/Chrzof1/2305/Cz11g10110.t1